MRNLNTYKSFFFILICCYLSSYSYAQTELFINEAFHISKDQVVHIEGDLINNTSHFDNQGELFLVGNMTNTAPILNPAEGYLIFEGNKQQILHLYAPFEQAYTQINNPNGLSMQGSRNWIVSQNLDFLNGIITTSNNSHIHFKAGATHINSDDNAHINGICSRTGKSHFTFPIGKNNTLRPISIGANSAGQLITFSAEYFNRPFRQTYRDETVDFVIEKEFWQLNSNQTTHETPISLIYKEQNPTEKSSQKQIAHFKQTEWQKLPTQFAGIPFSEHILTASPLLTTTNYFTFSQTSQATSSISMLPLQYDVYPNPVQSKDQINISIQSPISQKNSLRCYDLNGKLVFQKDLQLQQGYNQYIISLKEYNLTTAPYLLYLGERQFIKLIVE